MPEGVLGPTFSVAFIGNPNRVGLLGKLDFKMPIFHLGTKYRREQKA